MSSAPDLASLLTLHQIHIDYDQLDRVIGYFGSFQDAIQASDSDWIASQILRPSQQKAFFGAQRNHCLQRADEALAWSEQDAQTWLTIYDDAFPENLKNIDKPPPILGVRGDIEWLKQPQLAVVGSRHASQSGLGIAQDFAKYLSAQGLTITSGLALGIDAMAHQGGLLGAGKTIAVVATGLDRIYPAANQHLGRQIAEEGAMVSEFPLGEQPKAFHFPQRNRIISGLSVGTLVVEAALKSGSLITARTAMEQGREVFAVPGSIHNPQAKGCHQLIKQGAKLVESGQDIFEEIIDLLPFELLPASEKDALPLGTSPRSNNASSLIPNHSKLLEWIEFEPISLDELAVLSKMPVSQIQADLMMLELGGHIEKLSAGRWRRLR